MAALCVCAATDAANVLQAVAKHKAAVKERKKANQEKSLQVQKVGGVCCGWLAG